MMLPTPGSIASDTASSPRIHLASVGSRGGARIPRVAGQVRDAAKVGMWQAQKLVATNSQIRMT